MGIYFVFSSLNRIFAHKKKKEMELPIASIPVLTGEVARHFEAEAETNYQRFLNRTPEEERLVRERFEKGMAIVRKVLQNSTLGTA